MLSRRLAVPFVLGVMLATAAFVGCAIDPNPPNPHVDAGFVDDLLADTADGGDGGEGR
jgi:hypothetical protein